MLAPETHPVYLPGKVYLAGPYQGAPLSLVFITPAVSGPYDLGNVATGEGLRINPDTAQVSTVGTLSPDSVAFLAPGVRSGVNLNRPNFTLNPTNCNPFSVTTEIVGNQREVAHPSEHYQVANRGTPPLRPQTDDSHLRFHRSHR